MQFAQYDFYLRLSLSHMLTRRLEQQILTKLNRNDRN